MKTLRIAIAALVVLAIAALSGIGRPEAAESASEDARGGITVTGVGRVNTVPDEAEFSLGITTEGRTAGGALAANSERMRKLIEALKAAGVAERDIQTRDVSVGSDYDQTGRSDDFVASNTVSILIRDLDRAGGVLDAAAQAGANNIYGPSLTRSNREGLEARALEDAVANARKRAVALANAAGIELGAVTAISEAGAAMPGPMELRAMDAAASSPPIEQGTQEIQATVTVTFAID
jgi:uncharacterized protein YggE